MVVRSRSTCFTSGTGRGPSVGVVRACRAFRAGSSRRGAGPIIVGASGARQTCCAGGGADAAAVRPRGTCRAGGNGGRSRVAVVGSLRAQCARGHSLAAMRLTSNERCKRSLCAVRASSSTCGRVLPSCARHALRHARVGSKRTSSAVLRVAITQSNTVTRDHGRFRSAHHRSAGTTINHTLHWLAAVEPTSWLYVPAAHASQAALDVDPVLVLYVPAGHSVQAAADVEPVRSL